MTRAGDAGRAALTDSVKKNYLRESDAGARAGHSASLLHERYGAIEMGVHRSIIPARDTEGVGEGRFIHLWQYRMECGE